MKNISVKSRLRKNRYFIKTRNINEKESGTVFLIELPSQIET